MLPRPTIAIAAALALCACIAAPLPPTHEPGETEHEGGDVAADGGGVRDDGGSNGGSTAQDGGSPTGRADGGARDGGASSADGGSSARDGGSPPRDAGAPVDAGAQPPRDAGVSPPVDAGPPPECSYVPKDESQYTCIDTEASLWFGRVLAAIDTLYREQAQLFDFTDNPYGCCPRVVDADGYVQGVAAVLNRSPDVCAMQDPNAGDELAVKDRRSTVSEGFDILTADNYVRRGPGAFRGTCHPSWF